MVILKSITIEGNLQKKFHTLFIEGVANTADKIIEALTKEK